MTYIQTYIKTKHIRLEGYKINMYQRCKKVLRLSLLKENKNNTNNSNNSIMNCHLPTDHFVPRQRLEQKDKFLVCF